MSNVKQYIAFFLIVVMALSVVSAAGVVAAPKAAAARPQPLPEYIPVQWAQTTYTYTSAQYNVHWTKSEAYGMPSNQVPVLKTVSKGNTVSASVKATKGQYGYSQAMGGIQWEITGVPDSSKLCTIKVTVKYTLSAQGDAKTSAQLWQPVTGSGEAVTVMGTDTPNQITNTKTFTRTGTMASLFNPHTDSNAGTIHYDGWAGVQMSATQAEAATTATAQATASATITSITLTFE